MVHLVERVQKVLQTQKEWEFSGLINIFSMRYFKDIEDFYILFYFINDAVILNPI